MSLFSPDDANSKRQTLLWRVLTALLLVLVAVAVVCAALLLVRAEIGLPLRFVIRLRMLRAFTGYWAFAFCGILFGIRWKERLQALMRRTGADDYRIAMWRILLCCCIAYGIYALHLREIDQVLLYRATGTTFGETSPVRRIFDWIMIFVTFAAAGHYLRRLVLFFLRRRERDFPG